MRFRLKKGRFSQSASIRFAALAAAAVIIIAAGIHIYNRLVSDAVRGPVLRRAVTVINEKINGTVSRYLSENPSLSAECFVDTVSGGDVRSLKIDTELIRRAESEIVHEISDALADESIISVSIPSGSLTGISYLSGRGIPIRVRAYMSSGISSDVRTLVDSAGFNQSLYRVILEVSVTAEIIMPGGNDSVTVTSEATLAERVIIGDVPLSGT